MYCKQCHSKIAKNTINCPVCGFNNSNDFEMGKTAELDLSEIIGKKAPVKNNTNYKLITAIAIIVIGSVILLSHFLYDSKATDVEYYTTTTTKEVVNTKEFKLDNFKFYYTFEFERDNNIIYLIEDHNINITFDIIDDETYYEILNNNEILDTSLNEIDAQTYANDNNYGYLIDYNNKKYHIYINYTDDITEEVQASINKILKSIEIK